MFGLSSGEKDFKPAIICHVGAKYHRPASRVQRGRSEQRIGSFRMKLVKSVLLFRSDFPGFSGEGH